MLLNGATLSLIEHSGVAIWGAVRDSDPLAESTRPSWLMLPRIHPLFPSLLYFHAFHASTYTHPLVHTNNPNSQAK